MEGTPIGMEGSAGHSELAGDTILFGKAINSSAQLWLNACSRPAIGGAFGIRCFFKELFYFNLV